MPARRGMKVTVALACDGKEGEGVALRGQEEEEEEEGAGGREGRWEDAEGSERVGRRGDGRMREGEGGAIQEEAVRREARRWREW